MSPAQLPLELINEIIVMLTCAYCHQGECTALKNRAEIWHVCGFEWCKKTRPLAEPTTPDMFERRKRHKESRSRSSSSRQTRQSVDAATEPGTPTSRPRPGKRRTSSGQKRRVSRTTVDMPESAVDAVADNVVNTSTTVSYSKPGTDRSLPTLDEDQLDILVDDHTIHDPISVSDSEAVNSMINASMPPLDTVQPEMTRTTGVDWSYSHTPGSFDYYDGNWSMADRTASAASVQSVIEDVQRDLDLLAERLYSEIPEVAHEEDSLFDRARDDDLGHLAGSETTIIDPVTHIREELFRPHSRSRASRIETIASLFQSLKHHALTPGEGGVYGMQLLGQNADTARPYIKIGMTRGHWTKRIFGVEKEADATFDHCDVIWEAPEDSSWIERLENYVHTDLSHYRHRRFNRLGAGARSQTEWFQVSMNDAKIIVGFWREICDELSRQQRCGDTSLADKIKALPHEMNFRRVSRYTHQQRITYYRKKMLGSDEQNAKQLQPLLASSTTSNTMSQLYYTAGPMMLITVSTMAGIALLHLLCDILYHFYARIRYA